MDETHAIAQAAINVGPSIAVPGLGNPKWSQEPAQDRRYGQPARWLHARRVCIQVWLESRPGTGRSKGGGGLQLRPTFCLKRPLRLLSFPTSNELSPDALIVPTGHAHNDH
jgi:hypothetical protein